MIPERAAKIKVPCDMQSLERLKKGATVLTFTQTVTISVDTPAQSSLLEELILPWRPLLLSFPRGF